MRSSLLSSTVAVFCLTSFAWGSTGVWLDVPFVQQEKNGCGAASIAMVMRYWQRQSQDSPEPPEPQIIHRSIYSQDAKGIYASQIEQYFKLHGFRTFTFRGTISDLQHHLHQGRPLIVALQPTAGSLHYVVVTGLDSQDRIVLKNDPAERKLLKQEQPEFEKQWKAAGNWTLLAVPLEPGSAPSPHSSH